MKLKLNLVISSAFAILSLSACGAIDQAGTELDDVELLQDGDPGKADALSTTSTYYTMHIDMRKCVSPLCGGDWVKRVNFSTTKCVNGGYSSECYVAERDFSALGPDAEQLRSIPGVVFRGSIVAKTFGSFGKMGVFKATEAWVPGHADAVASGTFYKVKDTGIQCKASPCFSFHEAKLNSTTSTELSSVSLDGSGATDDEKAKARESLSSADGLIISGTNVSVPGQVGTGKELKATQFFLRFAAPPPDCRSTGCGRGQYCTFCWINYACIPEGAVC